MLTLYLKDENSHRNYRPVLRLVKIEGGTCEYPKVGELIFDRDIEALVSNGCQVVITPKDGVCLGDTLGK